MTASADAALAGGANSITRREFLNYAWLATIGVVTAEFAVVTYVFALPRLGPGAFGGLDLQKGPDHFLKCASPGLYQCQGPSEPTVPLKSLGSSQSQLLRFSGLAFFSCCIY